MDLGLITKEFDDKSELFKKNIIELRLSYKILLNE